MENLRITGDKNVDTLILEKLDNKTLLETCSLNSYLFGLCDNNFFKNRMKKEYFNIFQNKPENLSWKDYFLRTIFYIDKMKREYNFDFTNKSSGDPKNYYLILKGISPRTGKYHNFDNIRDLWHHQSLLAITSGYEDLYNYFEDKLH
jgi:hypothetical protein